MTGGIRSVQATRYFPDVSFPASVDAVRGSMIAHHAPREAVRYLDRFPHGHVFARAVQIPPLPGVQLHPDPAHDFTAPADNEMWGVRRRVTEDTTPD